MRYLVLSLAISLLLAACNDNVPAPTTPTASPIPSSVGYIPLTLGPGVSLPEGLNLLLETGCWQCDGPATGLIRVSRDAAGAHRDLLVSAGAHKLYGEEELVQLYFAGDIPIPREMVDTSKGQQQYDPYVTGIATGPNGSEIVVSVCVYPGCGVGMDAWSADGRVALYRSTDGGNSWADFGTIDGGAVLGFVSPEKVVAYSPTGPDGPLDIFTYPGRETLVPPQGPNPKMLPLVLGGGDIAWWDADGRFTRPDGSVILNLPHVRETSNPAPFWAAQQPFGDHRIAVYWVASGTGPSGFISLFESNGQHLRTYSVDRSMMLGVWVSDTVLAGNASVESSELDVNPPEFYPYLVPALIDLEAKTISPITDPFLLPGMEAGRNIVRGASSAPP